MLAILKNKKEIYRYFEFEDEIVIRQSETGEEVSYPDWAVNILLEDLQSFEIVWVNREYAQAILNNQDETESLENPQIVLEKIKRWLEC